jgi:hypothetical protein
MKFAGDDLPPWLVRDTRPAAADDLGGNLTVGGSGKTPIAIWIARYFAAQGLKPGILLRGYGGDETLVHRRSVPEAIVVANADRVAGADAAMAAGRPGAGAGRCVPAARRASRPQPRGGGAETTRAVRWAVPAGPWREGVEALDRADALIVTRKRATREAARCWPTSWRARVKARWRSRTSGSGHLEGLVSGSGCRRANSRGSAWWRQRGSPIPMRSWPR